jgi:hypothetical protein
MKYYLSFRRIFAKDVGMFGFDDCKVIDGVRSVNVIQYQCFRNGASRNVKDLV